MLLALALPLPGTLLAEDARVIAVSAVVRQEAYKFPFGDRAASLKIVGGMEDGAAAAGHFTVLSPDD